MRFVLLILSIITLCSLSVAQNKMLTLQINDDDAVKNILAKSIGENWELFNYSIGDINNDSIEDLIVIIQSTTDQEAFRKILLYVNEKGNQYRLAASNNNIIDCATCGGAGIGDPYRQIIIKYNYFSFEMLYGACEKTAVYITFKYDKKRKWWYLHKDMNETYNNCTTPRTKKDQIIISRKENNKSKYGKLRFENYQ